MAARKKAAPKKRAAPKKPPSAADAARLLEKDREARAAACQSELAALLEKHRCRIQANPYISEGRILVALSVTAV